MRESRLSSSDRRKSALILVQNLPVPFDRRVWQEATTLVNNGWAVSVICPSNKTYPEGYFEIGGISVYRFKAVSEARGPLGYLIEYGQSLSRMRKLVKKVLSLGSIDVVQFCNPPDLLALLARKIKRKNGVKVIFDQHDLGPELVIAKGLPAAKLFVMVARFFEKIAYTTADRVIATNESYQEIALDRGKIPAQHVEVVRSAPSKTWADDAVKSDKWRSGHQFQIGYLGVIGQQEGLHFALEALEILLKRYFKDVYFTVVGSGTDLEKMVTYATKLNLENNVKFFGRVPDKDMKDILCSSDVCINPDVFSQLNNLSTMNKIIEYMALGVPIVQFDLLEGRRSAEGSSLYAEPDSPESLAEKLNWLLENKEACVSMSQLGRSRFAEVLCWEKQEAKLLGVYEDLILQRP